MCSSPFWLHCNGCGALSHFGREGREERAAGRQTATSTVACRGSGVGAAGAERGDAKQTPSVPAADAKASETSEAAGFTRDFFVATCSHVYCKRCMKRCSSMNACGLCKRSPFVAHSIDESLPSSVAKFFAPLNTIFDDSLKRWENTAAFLQAQEVIFKQRMTTKFNALQQPDAKDALIKAAQNDLMRQISALFRSHPSPSGPRTQPSKRGGIFDVATLATTKRPFASAGMTDSYVRPAEQHSTVRMAQDSKKPRGSLGAKPVDESNSSSNASCSIASIEAAVRVRGLVPAQIILGEGAKNNVEALGGRRPAAVAHSASEPTPSTAAKQKPADVASAPKLATATSSARAFRADRNDDVRRWIDSLPTTVAGDCQNATLT